MGESIVHILAVDDFPSWRRFVASILEEQPRLRIVGEASDGLEAAQKAQELQPDIIMLDICLPRLNGIEAARRIRELSPKAKIVFLSENRSWDIVEEALGTGAGAYVVKSDAVAELLPAVEAVLKGKLFVSASLAGDALADPKNEPAAEPTSRRIVLPFPPQNVRVARRHEVGFYSHDRNLIDDVTQFVGAALRLGNGAIVVATESHRSSLLSRLQAYGIDMGAAVEEGRYIAWDAAGALSAFMLDGLPDPVRFLKLMGAPHCDSCGSRQGRTITGRTIRRVCATPVDARQDRGGDSDGEARKPINQGIRRRYSMRVFFERSSGRNGRTYLPTNL